MPIATVCAASNNNGVPEYVTEPVADPIDVVSRACRSNTAAIVFVLVTGLLHFRECTTDAGLIDRFFRSKIIAFSAQLTLRCRRSRALLAWPWLRPRQFLSPA